MAAKTFRTGVIVRGNIPAHDGDEALALLCKRICEGIGPEPDDGRCWDIAIAAGFARAAGEEPTARVNEALLIDLGREVAGSDSGG